jgi:hypothetical protein
MTKGMANMSIFAHEAIRTSDQVQDILALLSTFSGTAVEVRRISQRMRGLENRLQGNTTERPHYMIPLQTVLIFMSPFR